MRSLPCTLLASLLLSVLSPGQRTPRFTLPPRTLDYSISNARTDRLGLSLPPGNDDGTETANEQATLGRVLFHDTLLSRNGARSCSSCHRQDRAFSDVTPKSAGFAGRPTKRNSMPIANLAFHPSGFFWDARSTTLEEMVVRPIQDPVEMGLDLPTLIERLRAEPGYPDLFRRAFGDSTIDGDRIAKALARFVRAIVSVGSRYDAGLALVQDPRQDFPEFTAAENRGKRLFFGAGGWSRSCASCHVASRTLPCGQRAEIPADLQSDACRNNGLDRGNHTDDPGRGSVTHVAADRGGFRAASLRNIELTAPYMHDGRFATLDDVVKFYASGVRSHPELDPWMRVGSDSDVVVRPPTIEPVTIAGLGGGRGFPMGKRDRDDLVAFLKTLTDHELVRDPRFSNPFE